MEVNSIAHKKFDEVLQEKLQEQEKRPVEDLFNEVDAYLSDPSEDEKFIESREKYKVLRAYHLEALEKLKQNEQEEEVILQKLNASTDLSLTRTLAEEYCAHIQKQSALKGSVAGIQYKRSAAAVLWEQELHRHKAKKALTKGTSLPG